MIRNVPWLIPLFVVFSFGFWGLRWGLPSQQRAELFLTADQHTVDFYAEIEQARLNWYQQIGENPIAHFGRAAVANTQVYPTDLMLCFSSYLIRSHNADEQAGLVMVSRLNPLKGKWYPYNFQYGGAYIYPFAVFLGVGQVTGAISLVRNTSFYYAHPDKMADIFFYARIWSLIGLALTALALLKIVERHWNTRIAVWTTLFYVLLPAILGLSRISKPHIWSPLWTLLGLHFALEHKKDASIKPALISAVFFGLAVGTTISQAIYVPFLGWCMLQKDRGLFFRNSVIAAVVAVGVFLITNPTLPFHWQDFRYEQASNYSSMTPHLRAFKDFFVSTVPYSMTRVLAAIAYLGVLYNCAKGESLAAKSLAWLTLILSIPIALQSQGFRGDPQTIRLYLPHLALFSLMATLLLEKLPFRTLWRSALLAGLVFYSSLYCRHCASDVAPNDNASHASQWIQQHIPKGNEIGLVVPIPLVDIFPPLPFSDYKFVYANRAELGKQRPAYFVIHGKNNEAKANLLRYGYSMIQRFADSPLQKYGFEDRLSNANFVVEIYSRT